MTIDVSDPDAATLYPQVRADMRTFLGVTDVSQGPAGTITIGAVETVAASDSATVTNRGTETAAVLDFAIPRGEDGAAGAAGTITIGAVETAEPGEPASVTNGGTETAAVLNFALPRGADGTDGIDGADGAAATITVGAVETAEPGEPASVTNGGTETAAVLNFALPRGADGTDGTDGADGAAATITIGAVETAEPGEPASVTNGGTETAAVLNFALPRGADGTDGADGADGAAATITIGAVTTLESGEPASVINTGTETAAVLNFGIPTAPPAEGTMLAATYDPDSDGVIGIEQGGTGATSAEAAREALGIARAEDLTSAIEKIQDDCDELAWSLMQKLEAPPRGIQLRGTSSATNASSNGSTLAITILDDSTSGYNNNHDTENICTIDASNYINISSDIGRVRVTATFELSRDASGSANVSVKLISDVYVYNAYAAAGSIAFASSTNGFVTVVSPDIIGGSKFKLIWMNDASSSITATVEASIYIEVLD